MIASKILSALAVVSVAAAQSASICSQATATINAQADAALYTNCPTIKGSVLIGPNANGVIMLDGPTSIDGDLIANNAGGLTQFGSATIGRITGSFNMFNLTVITSLTMDKLVEVGSISWTSLPQLTQLTFTAVVKKASKVLITDTYLKSLTGINLVTVDELDINNNPRLTEFSSQLANITRSVNIDTNNPALQVTFPNLIWAANMTFRNTSGVDLPSLSAVNGSLGFYGNTFEELKAPNLTAIGTSFAFVANSAIQNLTFPVLTSVGGANLIANNSALTGISFPALKTVGGAIDFSGSFESPSLPELDDVKGGFNMQSKKTIDCAPFQKLSGNVIQGTFTCKSAADTVQAGVGTGGSGTGTGSAAPTGTKGAANSYRANSAIAGVSVLGGLLGFLI